MLSFSCLKLFPHSNAESIVAGKTYIGFYVPLNLEFVLSLPGQGRAFEERCRYFQLAFNCVAAKSLLFQISSLISNLEPDPVRQLVMEARVVANIAPIWCHDPEARGRISSISDLLLYLDVLYSCLNEMETLGSAGIGWFSGSVLGPIVSVLPRLTQDLGLDPEATTWMACVDETEYLQEPFWKCLNTFMRSYKRPLVVKIATLPFKHVTRQTLCDNEYVSTQGNDFNYRSIDSSWSQEGFRGLCDHICGVRLAKTPISSAATLDEFLGIESGADDLVDYYRMELPREASYEQILAGISAALSPQRRARMQKREQRGISLLKPYFNKFAPVYFVRRMKQENQQGARTAGWLRERTW